MCTRVAWHHPNADWTMWVATTGEPLPKRLFVGSKSRTRRPRMMLAFKDRGRGAVVRGEERAVAVGRRAAAVRGDEGYAAVGRRGAVAGKRYEDYEGWRVAAGVGSPSGGSVTRDVRRAPERHGSERLACYFGWGG
jgi:hypothetical protein